MSQSEFLFPQRQSRRDFLAWTGAAVVGSALGATTRLSAEAPEQPVTLGTGKWTYTLDPKWGRLPAGQSYGFGCAIVADRKDRIFVTSRSANPCVAIFSPQGELLETWSNDFAQKIQSTTDDVVKTAHGLYCSLEGDQEFLYFTENKPGARVYKTDLEGRILYELGNVRGKGSNSQKFDFVNPTDVAVAPNGDIYIVDGYGSQLVHRFDSSFHHLQTMGGRGKEHGQFNTCHGVWVTTLGDEPEVYIADRANDRLEVYSMDFVFKRSVSGVRKPCCFYQHAGHLYVPELDARVTILDADDQIVAHLGDGQGIPREELDKHPDKFAAPHALTVDSHGGLYVLEWLPTGRPRKFTPTA